MTNRTITLAELPVYVIHGTRAPERRDRLEPQLRANRIEAPEWVTDWHAPTLPAAAVGRYYRPSRWRWRRRSAATFRTSFKRLTPGEIAVAISHVETWRTVAARREEWSLILEDDVVLADDFASRFDEYFAALPRDADLVFIGSCCNLRIPDPEPGRHFYRKEHPATKCADSYLVRRGAIARVLETIIPFTLPLDWELNYHLKRHEMVVYWLEPPLVTQGSETGLYASSVR